MFFDVFRKLCDQKGVSPSRAALDCGLSKSAVSQWKTRGSSPQFEQLSKIAAYFDVSVDYLLGNEEKEKPATPAGDEHDILDGVDVAFYGDYKELTEDEKEILRDMVRAMRERRQKKKEE